MSLAADRKSAAGLIPARTPKLPGARGSRGSRGADRPSSLEPARAGGAEPGSGGTGQTEKPPARLNRPFPVVGIGIFDGGLSPALDLLSRLPAGIGIAFVVFDQLGARQRKIMKSVLSVKLKQLRFIEAFEGCPITPDHVYLVPARSCLLIRNGKFHITPQSLFPHGQSMIEYSFRSLALDQRRNAVGILFPGRGMRGLAGLQAVKEAGGVTFLCRRSAKRPDPAFVKALSFLDAVAAPDRIVEQFIATLRSQEAALQEWLPAGADGAAIGADRQKENGHPPSEHSDQHDAYRIQLDNQGDFLSDPGPVNESESRHRFVGGGESQHRFVDLYDFAPVGYLSLDGGGRVCEINRTGALMLGIERLHVIGQPFALFVTSRDAGRLSDHIRRCRRRKTGRTITRLTIELPGGEKSAVQLLSVAMEETDKRQILYRTIMTDRSGGGGRRKADARRALLLQVHARRQAVIAELSQSAVEDISLRILMQKAASLVAQTLDVEYSRIMHFHEAGDALLLRFGHGWGQNWIGHAMERADFTTQAGYTFLTGEPVIVGDSRAQERFRAAAYLRAHRVASSATARIQGASRPFGVLAVESTRKRAFGKEDLLFIRSVANVLSAAIKRKEGDDALRDSHAILRTVIEGTVDGVFMKDLGGRYKLVNSAMARIMGRPIEDILGKDDAALFPQAVATQLQENDAKLLAAGGEGQMFEESVPAMGSFRTFLTMKTVHRGPGGETIGIIGVSRDITERKQMTEHIEQELKKKINVLLQEIHHRVKNNLQIISSLLNLQSGYVTDERTLSMFRECQDRVRSMALIHEKLYQSKELSKIEFAGYIRSLTLYLFNSYRTSTEAVLLKVDAENVFLDIDMAVPCGLIINELVSNSLKSAFPVDWPGRKRGMQPEISITMAVGDTDMLTLTVADNGTGFPPDFDAEASPTLGLRLVRTLAEQLSGKLSLESRGGAIWKLAFRRNGHD